ncbi:uncharacterized protein LOC126670234 isoform X2 [Mercurialis annua]|uniref:uncharacterized protein LOC126670234 isoform X2 n=1 Tax=Mercurialis annua TaxID=3986 RepID=UPI00215FA342|nr:uncharacterized protein LOC126670234 isoform X2 [Mercurialis annua]
MGTEVEVIEGRLKSFLEQFKTECGIFERIVYKNKNQHRRSSYFHYLLKVRRDLRLLQSAKLEEILASCFHVITERKPKQKVHLLESLKWKKCNLRVPNFMERLLGAARLLSQMVEPMLKAATEISTLLARSFFMGFSLTVLALLARLRVLVQQILLDAVSAFNMVSSLSQKKQSVKITQEGLEVFREYYPIDKEFITLDCIWEMDKFVLLETTHNIDVKSQDEDLGEASNERSALQYTSIESFLGDDSQIGNMNENNNTTGEASTQLKEDKTDLFACPERRNEEEVEGGIELNNNLVDLQTANAKLPPEGDILATSGSSPSSKTFSLNSGARPVAFLSVKRPALSGGAFTSVKRRATSTSNSNITNLDSDESKTDSRKNQDSFFNLLTGGDFKESLF